jgi:hypothetical protein
MGSRTDGISMTECTLPPELERSPYFAKCWHGPVAFRHPERYKPPSALVRQMCPPCPICGVLLLPGRSGTVQR